MAEVDAEIALLHKLQADQANKVQGEGGTNGAANGAQPFTSENINKQEKKETVTDDQVLRAHSPLAGDASSLSSIPAVTVSGQQGSRSSSRASIRKPKTIGGFIADDSDEEYDAMTPEPATSLQASAPNTPNRAIVPSPLHNTVSQTDLKTDHQTMGASTSNILTVNSSITGVTPSVQVSSQIPNLAAPSIPKARLPQDKVGILEDRIREDPRGDIEAWRSLIDEYRSRNKLEDARLVYERFFRVFPQAAQILVEYVQMELDHDHWSFAETIFSNHLLQAPNVDFWSSYMTYIRRMNDTNNDPTGNNRTTVAQAYKFVLDNIGIDRESGRLWSDYINFLKSTPGIIGGSSWQDQNKSDQLRQVYHRAVSTPMTTVNQLWKDYDQFEQTLNKGTARKFVQDHSPAYMTARSANSAFDNVTRGLERTTLPRLPPTHGFQGDEEYLQQVGLWKKWISWEREEDPLVLKDSEKDVWKSRVLYVYKQAITALRFWPEVWVEAAEWCFENDLTKEGDEFLNNGVIANPESCLVAFKKADHLESNSLSTADPVEKGRIVRAPYDKVLERLYTMHKQLKSREAQDLAKLEASSEVDDKISAILSKAEDDDEENEAEKNIRALAKENQVKAIQQGYIAQAQLIQRMISFAWIALMRAMRRVQGKGGVKDAVGGSRQVFADARTKGKLTSDVYIASALMEHTVYKDAAGTKIFERGAKLFPEDEGFILEYLKHLLSLGDTTNARVTFETSVSRLTSKPGNVAKAKRLYSFFHKYESQYGELSQIQKLEKRMAELYPEDPKLLQFSNRFSDEGFDPTAARPIISPSSQMQPKRLLMQSIEQPSIPDSPRPLYQEASPRPQYLQATNSPKRPFQTDDENDFNRPRKLARGESPLKGAAGRRLDQQKRLQNQGTPQWQSAAPFVIPRDITFLMSIIPRSDLYQGGIIPPETLVKVLSQTHIPDYGSWRASQQQQQQHPTPQQQYGYSYGR